MNKTLDNNKNEQCNLHIVTHSNLKFGMNVVDAEQNKGTIVNIDDLHNVEVDFQNGGRMLGCFVKDCEEYKTDLKEIPIFYCG
tara:strand:- start:274 stop:522 length:249 start_codon:yes stop_codon:yes gene_type:complete